MGRRMTADQADFFEPSALSPFHSMVEPGACGPRVRGTAAAITRPVDQSSHAADSLEAMQIQGPRMSGRSSTIALHEDQRIDPDVSDFDDAAWGDVHGNSMGSGEKSSSAPSYRTGVRTPRMVKKRKRGRVILKLKGRGRGRGRREEEAE